MKQKLFKGLGLLFCALTSTILTAQNLPNYTFSNPVEQACYYDTLQVDSVFPDWDAFQTIDSTRWGARDSNCFSTAFPPSGNAILRWQDLDHNKPVYFNSRLVQDSITVALDSNSLYRVEVNANSWPLQLQSDTLCKEGLCSGMELGIEIPDSAGTGFEIRWYRGYSIFNGSTEFCFPTEKFPNGNAIHRAWLKFTPDPTVSNTNQISIYGVYIQDMRYTTEQIRQVNAQYFSGTNWIYELDQFWGGPSCQGICPNKMFMYNDTTYPSLNNPSFVDVFPTNNTSTVEHIEIIVNPTATALFQPYTYLRGGQVLGDTLRHTYNFINNGGTICTYGFIELNFQGGNDYTHRSGKVEFNSPNSCFRFGKGSTLRVEDGSVFHYGKPGRGMLALQTGAQIEVGKGSELILQNKVVFGEYKTENEPASIRIDLLPGSKLTFAPGASLSNELSKFPEREFLWIYMRGGELDDSGLSPQDRALIKRVYVNPVSELDAALEMQGNPFAEQLRFSLEGNAGQSLDLAMFNPSGQLTATKSLRLSAGTNEINWDLPELPQGVYLLRVKRGSVVITRKVIKM